MGDLILFLEGRISELTTLRDEAEEQEEWSMHDYLAGCIDAYDIVLMRLTKTS